MGLELLQTEPSQSVLLEIKRSASTIQITSICCKWPGHAWYRSARSAIGPCLVVFAASISAEAIQSSMRAISPETALCGKPYEALSSPEALFMRNAAALCISLKASPIPGVAPFRWPASIPYKPGCFRDLKPLAIEKLQ